MEQSYNLRNLAVKRLMKEAEELRNPTSDYCAKPLNGDLFEWHFTFCGPVATEFEGGIYHGCMFFPPDYPMAPPRIMLLNPNGKFEPRQQIFIDSWQPGWNIRTIILSIISYMSTKERDIGALNYSTTERKKLAEESRLYSCPSCGEISELLYIPAGASHDGAARNREAQPSSSAVSYASIAATEATAANTSTTGLNLCHAVKRLMQKILSFEGDFDALDYLSTFSRIQTLSSQSRSSSRSSSQRRPDDLAYLVVIIVLVIVIALLMFGRLDKAFHLTSAFM